MGLLHCWCWCCIVGMLLTRSISQQCITFDSVIQVTLHQCHEVGQMTYWPTFHFYGIPSEVRSRINSRLQCHWGMLWTRSMFRNMTVNILFCSSISKITSSRSFNIAQPSEIEFLNIKLSEQICACLTLYLYSYKH